MSTEDTGGPDTDRRTEHRRIRTQLEYALGIPFSDGNRITALHNGDQIFPAMLDAIADARESIDFATFVYWTGDIAVRFAEALAERARAGVRVRVLLDAIGAKRMPASCVETMERAGVDLRWFRPIAPLRFWRTDKRTHRKLLVLDGRLGFTGGVGIAREWTGDARNPSEWRDDHFRIDGPASHGLAAAFLDNWNEAGTWAFDEAPEPARTHDDGVSMQVVRASSTVGWTDAASLLWTLAAMSRRSLTLVTPYFVPDERLESLLWETAQRGVQVRLMIPGSHTDEPATLWAGQTSIERLLEAGIEIWKYQRTHLHLKAIVMDGVVSCIGSANLNHRSMGKDEECCVVVLSDELSSVLERRFDDDSRNAETLDLERWRKRGLCSRVLETLSRIAVEQL